MACQSSVLGRRDARRGQPHLRHDLQPAGRSSQLRNCRKDINSTRYEVDALRFVGGFEGDLFGGQLELPADYTYASTARTTRPSAVLSRCRTSVRDSLVTVGWLQRAVDHRSAACTTARPGQGNCDFFNIFGTSVTTTPGSLIANNEGHGDLTSPRRTGRASRPPPRSSTSSCRGPVFELPAGQFGARHRRPAPQRRLVRRLSGTAERGTERPAGAVLRQGRDASVERGVRRSQRASDQQRRSSAPSNSPAPCATRTPTVQVSRRPIRSSACCTARRMVCSMCAAPGAPRSWRRRCTSATGRTSCSPTRVNDGLTPQNDNLARVPRR